MVHWEVGSELKKEKMSVKEGEFDMKGEREGKDSFSFALKYGRLLDVGSAIATPLHSSDEEKLSFVGRKGECGREREGR